MKRRGSSITWLIASAGILAALCSSVSAEIITRSGIKQLDMRRTWHTKLPLAADETVQRAVVLDDNLYVLTSRNAAFTLHTPTGVLRWVRQVADEGQVIRGPSHSAEYVFFTTTGSVRVMHRHSGLAAGEPRHLEGVIIEVVGHSARLSIGELHGVRGGDVLEVKRMDNNGQLSATFASIKVTSVQARESQGRITRLGNIKVASGDVILADVVLPKAEIRLPRAASGPAVVDDEDRLYFAAANQRLYSIDMLSGFQHYQLATPRGMTITPVIYGDNMYIADHEGVVTAFDRLAYRKNWSFETEGPIFADLVVGDQYVLVASSDRSLYCLDRKNGKRLWRNRFETPLATTPALDHGRVYVNVDGEGIVVLDVATGKTLWTRKEASRFLAEIENHAYLATQGDYPVLLRVDAETGKIKAEAVCQTTVFAEGAGTDQSLFLVTPLGEIECLRHKSAPRLTKEVLAAALRNNELLKARARQLARKQVEDQKKPSVSLEDAAAARRRSLEWLFDDDWLSSRSTVKPVGGRDLVQPAGAAEESDDESADSEDEDEGDEASDDDDEESEDWDDEGWDDEDEEEDAEEE